MCHLSNLYHLPMVVHCQDVESHAGSPNQDASDACMVIMRKELPHQDHKVYLHCYNHGLPIFTSWLKCFANVWVGISPSPNRPQAPRLSRCSADPDARSVTHGDDASYLPDLASLGYEGMVHQLSSITFLIHFTREYLHYLLGRKFLI